MSGEDLMTAYDLIDSIFARPARGVDGSSRRITTAQLDYLIDLIGRDEEGAAIQRGRGKSLVWMPSGRNKYVVTEDPTGGDKHTLARLANFVPSGQGRLF